MISVSAAFTAAEVADIAQVAAAVYIYLGNYASSAFGSTATASDSDASGNYPASGAIDGDRTEINIGAPSAADNGVGLSSWKSASTPSGGSPAWLQVYFGQSRTFNYVKLYNLAADPLSAYTLQWSNDGTTWTTVATYASSYRINGGLDIFDLSGSAAITAKYVRVLITATTNSDAAQIVEIEVYNKIDVTGRATSIKTDRQRDWKQVNPMAATCTLNFDNSDRFFSIFHQPTATELAAGFIPWNPNAQPVPRSELDVGLKVQVQMGFWYSGTPYFNLGWGQGGFGQTPWGGGSGGSNSAPELVNTFVGQIDQPKANSKAGTCEIQGRDGMKDTINQTWSTKLKYNIDIGDAIRYCLNICNISDYEMSVDTTGIVIPYFYAYETSMLTVIQSLTQAAGNAQFWVDENGTATFKNLLAQSDTSQTDFVWPQIDMGAYSKYGIGTIVQNGGSLTITGTDTSATPTSIAACYPSTNTTGWQFSCASYLGGVAFMSTQTPGTWVSNDGNLGYIQGYVMMFSLNDVSFYVMNGSGGYTRLLDLTYNGNTTTTWTIFRVPNGGTYTFYVYANEAYKGSFSDNTYTTCSYFNVEAPAPGTGGGVGNTVMASIQFLNSDYSISASGGDINLARSSIDQGVNLASEGNLSVGFAPSNAPITYQTRTSSDGVTWGSWTSVTLDTTTQQGPITSTTERYIEYQFYFTIGAAIPLWTTYYVTVNWSLTASAASTRSVSYDSSLCDVSVSLSDNLGGDSSIINYFEVISAPISLSGSTGDVQWTATTGQPQNKVTASNPLVANTGTITIQAVVSGGMDVAYMGATATVSAGASGGAAGTTAFLVTMGTAAGTVSISYAHPTKPIITLTITTAGTITNLQLIGQSLSSSSNAIDIIAGDKSSIGKYKRRTNQISNNYIPNAAMCQLIANAQLVLYRYPAVVIEGMQLLLTPSAQLTDPIQATDYNLDISSSQTWNASGISHEITKASGQGSNATIQTTMKAVILPT